MSLLINVCVMKFSSKQRSFEKFISGGRSALMAEVLDCRCVAVRCSVFAVYCSALLCVAVCCSASQCVFSVLQCVCSVFQCVSVRCSVLQCVAVCCSVLQCVAVCL